MSEVLFTATVSAVGGREGKVVSTDGVLEHDVAMPGTPRAKKLKKQQIQSNYLQQATLHVLIQPFKWSQDKSVSVLKVK